MKKNKMMRTASGLLVATLLTTSVISGTFAKYTTSAESSDSARVAKWGVAITMADDNSIFSSEYDTDDNANKATIGKSVTASASNSDTVVAPGTTGATTFSIKGTPEVAFALDIAVEATSTIKVKNNDECTLEAGTFADTEVKVKLSADYEPIVFTLQKKNSENNEYTTVNKSGNEETTVKAENMTLSELETELEALSKTYQPNTEVNDEYKIVWSWPFTTEFSGYTADAEHKTYQDADVLDTYLGDEKKAQTESYKITITATQID